MRIGLLLQRATDLKWAGPLAEAALSKQHQLSLFVLEQESRASDKDYLAIRSTHCQTLIAAGAQYLPLATDEIGDQQQLMAQEALLMQEGYHTQQTNLDTWQKVRANGVSIYSLSHFFEICKRPLSALDYFDGTVYLSEYARELHQTLQEGSKVGNQVALGSPMFDQLRRVSREESRADLGIGAGERVVLLLAPVILPTTPWRFHVWRDASRVRRLKDALRVGEYGFLWEITTGHTFKRVFQAVHAFCERSKAQLIVKSRGKHKNLDFVAEASDQYFDGFGDEYYPQFSTYTLMAAADLCITVNSMAALEAAALGIPCVNLYVPHHDRAAASTPQKEAYNRELLGGRAGSIMNYAGAVKKVDRRAAPRFFADDWEQVHFEPSTTDEYAREFMGIEEQSASQRVLAYLEVAH